MALNPGTRLGVYEVTGTLGVGGMGEVYRARDTRLQREVALKILPETFAADPDRLARFEREAQVLASLNHPHIAALYGFEESSGARALVLELVEGMTLADRIVAGPLPLDESLAIAKQIAHALEAAHERGIVHRDLKPANIKITPDGTVKVLDFGLAKSLAPTGGAGDMSQSPTITTPAMTLAGVILGSAAYMSPEQAKGREADRRSDVWTFGCVLYEMLTGTRAFEAEDVSETLAAVLMRDPDWSRLPADVPPSVRTLLHRCLERDRRRRLGDIAGALLAMDESLVATGDLPNQGALHDRRASLLRVSLVSAAAAVAGALLAGVGVWLALRPMPSRDVVRFEVAPPPKIPLNGEPVTFGISPDGRTLAFITGAILSEQQIWIRPLSSDVAQRLSGTERASRMLWSPDSGSIVFTVGDARGGGGDGRLRRIGISGGPPITIAEYGVPGAWSRQGDILLRGRDGRLHRVGEGGGEPQPVTTLDEKYGELQHHAAFFLDDGRRFAFVAQAADTSESAMYLSSLDAPASRVKLLDGLGCPRFANGQLLYQREGTLMAQRFDEASGRFTGAAVPVVEGFGVGALTGCAFSVSSGGALAYTADSGAADSVLTWVDAAGRSLGRIGTEGGYTTSRRPSLSHDGRRLAVTRRERQGSDVWLIDLERDVPTRLTTDPADDEAPLLTPDGSRVIFRSNRKGQWDLYQRGSGGVGADEALNASEGTKSPSGFSPDGGTLLFSLGAGRRATETWALPMKDPSKPVALVSTGFPAGNAVFSPNGRWFAYCEGDAGADQVYVQPYPQNGTRVRLSPQSGSSPQWSADGKTVYFTRSDNYVIAVDVTTEGGELKAGVARELFLAPGTFDHRAVLADSARRRFLVPVPRQQVTAAIDVVLNWPALLKEN